MNNLEMFLLFGTPLVCVLSTILIVGRLLGDADADVWTALYCCVLSLFLAAWGVYFLFRGNERKGGQCGQILDFMVSTNRRLSSQEMAAA